LIDATGLGWCQSCGYCRSLEEERARGAIPSWDAAAPKDAASEPTGADGWLAKLPSWAGMLLGGVVFVVLINVPPSLFLTPDTLTRAVWSTVGVVLGVVMILAAQFWALMTIAPEDDNLGIKDLLVSGRLWVLTCKRLPKTSGQVWLGAWGLTAILSAVLLVGDLEHWLRYLPKSQATLMREAAERAARENP
jgi:hypothetical protein